MPVVTNGGYSLAVTCRFLIAVASRAVEQGSGASVFAPRGLRSCGSRAPEHRLCSRAHGLGCFAACGISPDQVIEPRSPALAGGFFATEPPGKLSLWKSPILDIS